MFIWHYLHLSCWYVFIYTFVYGYSNNREYDTESVPSLPSLPVRPRSEKQRPSHRKLRRWNNDKFVGVAAELARAGRLANSECFSLGETDTRYYERANDPVFYRSVFADLSSGRTCNGSLEAIRERFVEGCVVETRDVKVKNERDLKPKTNEDMYNQIDIKLRNVVSRVLKRDYGGNLSDAYEELLSEVFASSNTANLNHTHVMHEGLQNILLKTPEVLSRGDESNVKVVLEFGTSSPTGGLDRLILHAVCQFHGLLVTSQKAKGKCVVSVTGNYLGKQHTLSSTVRDSCSFVRRRSDVVMRSGSSFMSSSRTSDDDWLLVSSMGSMACRES